MYTDHKTQQVKYPMKYCYTLSKIKSPLQVNVLLN